MNYELLCVALYAFSIENATAQTDTAKEPVVNGSVMVEVNYGHHTHRHHPTVWDFPHILAEGTARLGRGWSLEANVEYERFRENGAWDNNARNDYHTNLLALTRQTSLGHDRSMRLGLGIVPVPLGITNSGGPALTIYDPISESEIMPMTWHDGGITAEVQAGYWKLTTGLYIYGRAPLSDSRVAGGAARLDCRLPQGLNVGASCYYGNTYAGQLATDIGAPEGKRHEFYSVFDFFYAVHGLTIDGSAVYSQAQNKNTYGVEAGLDVLQNVTANMQLSPYARYDGIFDHREQTIHRYTLGIDFVPIDGLTVKTELAWHHESRLPTSCQMRFGIGYAVAF